MATKFRTDSEPSSTVEQYIKIIYGKQERSSFGIVGMKELADAMEVTPGTATAMVKHLHKNSLVEYIPRKGVSLTSQGSRLALTMLRRHRLIETFLEQVLGYDWTEVHADAEVLEHAVSEHFVERIDAYLGRPEVDPHGDPIPNAAGVINARPSVPLNSCNTEDTVVIVRFGHDDRDFLLLMKEYQITPGETFIITEINETAGTLSMRHVKSNKTITLGLGVGPQIFVAREFSKG